MAEKPRILQNRTDLVLTMVPLVLLCLFVLFASNNFNFGFGADPKDETVAAIDPKGAFEVSAQTMGFPVRMPSAPGSKDGVLDGWKASATRTVELGDGSKGFSVTFVTPEKNFLELVQAGSALPMAVKAAYGTDPAQSGSSPVDGMTWSVYGPNEQGRSAWGLQLDGAAVVIYGSGTVPRFTELAAAVQSQAPMPRSSEAEPK